MLKNERPTFSHRREAPRQPGAWLQTAEMSLDGGTLQQLFDDRIPAIRIPGFATAEECQRLTDLLDSLPARPYRDVMPAIGKIGPSQFEAGEFGKAEYFRAAADAAAAFRSVFEQSFDPVERMRTLLQQASGLESQIATEPSGERYFAGAVRLMREGTLLHVDFARHDAPGWHVEAVEAQLAWNLCIRDGGDGGACTVFNRLWDDVSADQKSHTSYGLDDAVVAGCQSCVLQPKLGDAVLFNCRNYHRVAPSSGLRVTIGSFVGTMERRLLLWS